MLKSVEDAVKVDRIGEDDIPPLLWREGQLARLVEKVLVHGLPRSTCFVPGGKGIVDFEQHRVCVLNDRSAEVWL